MSARELASLLNAYCSTRDAALTKGLRLPSLTKPEQRDSIYPQNSSSSLLLGQKFSPRSNSFPLHKQTTLVFSPSYRHVSFSQSCSRLLCLKGSRLYTCCISCSFTDCSLPSPHAHTPPNTSTVQISEAGKGEKQHSSLLTAMLKSQYLLGGSEPHGPTLDHKMMQLVRINLLK